MAGYGGSEPKIYYSAENTYVKLGSRTHKDEVVHGRLLIVEKTDGYYVTWKPSEEEIMAGAGESSRTIGEPWAMVNIDAVGYKNDKRDYSITTQSVLAESHTPASPAVYTRSRALKIQNDIDFPITILKSFKRMPKTIKNHSTMIFILVDGTTLPPVCFQKGGSDKFIEKLGDMAFISKAQNDSNMFMVNQHQPDALKTSFDQLNLHSDGRNIFQKLASHPLKTTWNAFAKVTALLNDAFVPPDRDLTMDPDFQEQLMKSIAEVHQDNDNLPTVNSTNTEAHDFLMVDQKIVLPDIDKKARGNPLTRSQWNSFFSRDGTLANPETAKQIIFRGGVSHDLRNEVWKFLLGYYPWNSTAAQREELRKAKVDEYFIMKRQWMTLTENQINRFSDFKERQALIEKDVNRTDRTLPYFEGQGNSKLTQLNDILVTYVMYNFDLGYVQGMSDLLSPILFVMDNEVDAFWCFAGFMELVEKNFEMDQQGMKAQLNSLNQLLQIVDRRLYNYLDSHDSSNMYFAFRWLLILFKREFSFSDTMKVWEVMWTAKPCKNYHIIMAVALLHEETETIIQNEFGFTEILKHINDMSGHIDVDEFLMNAEVLAEQLLTCSKLPDYICRIIDRPVTDHSVGASRESLNQGEDNSNTNTSTVNNDNPAVCMPV